MLCEKKTHVFHFPVAHLFHAILMLMMHEMPKIRTDYRCSPSSPFPPPPTSHLENITFANIVSFKIPFVNPSKAKKLTLQKN